MRTQHFINGLSITNRKSEYRLADTDVNMIKEKLNSVFKLDFSELNEKIIIKGMDHFSSLLSMNFIN
jgi:hypothetical protein